MNGVSFRSEGDRWRRHHVFDVALSHSKHRTVGGGLPAMNDDAIFLIHRIDFIAGKPPPTRAVSIQHILCLGRPT